MSAHQDTVQLALRDEEEFTSVDMALTAEGGIDLSGQDMGPIVKQTWGDDDYEYGVRIAPADVSKLAFALIAEHYHGDLQAVQKVRELAERHGINPQFWDWT
ncbi:hypothetical protein [Sphingomonas paucimobilis]|uniref:Uncharacterized protein n=1 Tax=Sphingomonas paucimobilis TaxID=13689 RepID=A0A7Y2PB88_SPHPI|nr:hypothetical protein [Sphingomonas paucimobilis]NNG57129.1 hypothetical protein [Sphingomonas paucimobilis]